MKQKKVKLAKPMDRPLCVNQDGYGMPAQPYLHSGSSSSQQRQQNDPGELLHGVFKS